MPIRQAIYSILGCQERVTEIRRHGGIPTLDNIFVPNVQPAIIELIAYHGLQKINESP